MSRNHLKKDNVYLFKKFKIQNYDVSQYVLMQLCMLCGYYKVLSSLLFCFEVCSMELRVAMHISLAYSLY